MRFRNWLGFALKGIGPQPRSDAADAVRKLDTDGDGRLSQAEFHRPARVFNKADADRDGFISAEELAAFRQPNRP